MKNKSGKITIGFLVFVLLFAIALDASFQIIPIYMNYLNFNNEVTSRAIEIQQQTPDQLRAGLMKKAMEYNVPIDDEHLLIEFENHTTHIKATWSVQANLLAGYYKKTLTFTSETTRPNLRS